MEAPRITGTRQYYILKTLVRHPDGITIQELHARSKMTKDEDGSACYNTVRRLAKRDLVELGTAPFDERKKFVKVTKSGTLAYQAEEDRRFERRKLHAEAAGRSDVEAQEYANAVQRDADSEWDQIRAGGAA